MPAVTASTPDGRTPAPALPVAGAVRAAGLTFNGMMVVDKHKGYGAGRALPMP